jgi:predicted dehydrogenase
MARGGAKRVYAWTPTLAHDIEVEDCASALLEYQNGAQGFIYASTIQVPNQERFAFCGDNGRLILEEGLRYGQTVRGTVRLPSNQRRIVGTTPIRNAAVSAAEARKGIELINALILSHHKKKPVESPINRKEYDALLAKLIRQSPK